MTSATNVDRELLDLLEKLVKTRMVVLMSTEEGNIALISPYGVIESGSLHLALQMAKQKEHML